jgi:gliding motility-associated-like protein
MPYFRRYTCFFKLFSIQGFLIFFVFISTSLFSQFPNPVLFNTATNSTGTGTIPVGSNDLNWTSALTNSLGPFVPAVSCGNAAPGNWVTSPFPNANWISYPHGCSANPAEHNCLGSVDEFYRLTFTLPANSCGQAVTTPSAYCLSLTFYADNWVHQIFVNNISSYLNPNANAYNAWGFTQSNGVSVSLCNNWQVGTNTVLVHIKSGAPTFPGYSGFLAQANQTLNPSFNNPISTTVNATNIQCNGQSNGSATVSAAGGNGVYSYTWLPTGGNGAIASNLSAGVYTVLVSSGLSCVASETVSITQPPAFNLSVSPSTLVCNGAAVTLTAGGASNYQWSNGTNGFSVSVNSSGIYSVTGTQNGCSQTATVSVGVGNSPTINISGTGTLCAGGQATLNAAGAGTYSWSTGQSTPSIAVTPTANSIYTVSGYNSNPLCSHTETFSVLVYQNPQVSIQGNLISCGGGAMNLTASGADVYQWSTGENNSSITVTPFSNSTYSVTGFSSVSGCSNTAAAEVTVSTVPQLSITGGTVCAGTTVTLNASGASSYLWSTGQTGNTAVVVPFSSQVYTVTGYGTSTVCSTSQTVSVMVLSAPMLTISPVSPICKFQKTRLTVSGFTSYYWSTGDSLSSIEVSPLTSSIYSVNSIENQTGCIATATVLVVVNDLPPVKVLGDGTLCERERAKLRGVGAGVYHWSTGAMTANIELTVSENQLILLFGTDPVTGCSNVDSIRLGISPKCCEVFIPNTFTPDADGLNDGFGAKSECLFKEYHLYIFDKWGEKIFESDDIFNLWNGYFKGKLCQQDVYVYLIRAIRGGYTNGIKPVYEKTGHVLLLKN